MTSFKNAPLEGDVRMELVATIMSRMQENYNYTICLSLIHQSSGKSFIKLSKNKCFSKGSSINDVRQFLTIFESIKFKQIYQA